VTAATLQVVVAYLGLVGALAVAAAIGLRCASAVRTGVVVAEVLLLGQAMLAVVGYARGHRPADAVTNVGYVVVSLVLLPLLIGSRLVATGEAAAPARSDHLVVALACAVVAIVVLRMHATWR
jgi:hypothetical protein